MPKLKPTKLNQQRWVRRHLNNGVCPENEGIHWGSHSYLENACFESLEWLADAKPDITNLAEAWDLCPRLDWLIWCLFNMHPTQKDVKQVKKAVNAVLRSFKRSTRDWDFFLLNELDVKRCEEDWQELKSASDLSPRDALWETIECTHPLFEYCDQADTKLVHKRCNKYADIFRKHVPNPWVMK